jgi:hypothetical protein
MRVTSDVVGLLASLACCLASATVFAAPPKEVLVVHVPLSTPQGTKDELFEVESKALALRELVKSKDPDDQPHRNTACGIGYCDITYDVADADAALQKLLPTLRAWPPMKGGYVEKTYRSGKKERVPIK